MVYTTYFANLRKLPEGVTPVSICAKPPVGYTGLQYKKLAPKYDTLMDYKRTGDESAFVKQYTQTVLDHFSQSCVMQEIHNIAGPGDVALVCYEKSDAFCHRHIVAGWLRNHGYIVKEFIPSAS